MSSTVSQSDPRQPTVCNFMERFGFPGRRCPCPLPGAARVSHVYASPYLKSPGSTHVYDIVRPRTNFEPRISADDTAFHDMVAAFRDNGLGQVLDFRTQPVWAAARR